MYWRVIDRCNCMYWHVIDNVKYVLACNWHASMYVLACDWQVYERLDWRVMVISRSTTAACGVDQTAKSFSYKEGASLFLQLQESERDCESTLLDTQCSQSHQQHVHNGSVCWKCPCNVMKMALFFKMFMQHVHDGTVFVDEVLAQLHTFVTARLSWDVHNMQCAQHSHCSYRNKLKQLSTG